MRLQNSITRRRFLVQMGVAASSLLLGACGQRRVLRLTATPPPRSPPAATSAPTIPPSPTPSVQPADQVLLGGKVITMDARDTIAQAVAVRGDRVLAVGSDDEVRAFIGPETQVFELAGKLVTPGLIDAHNHLQVWGTLLNDWVPLIPPEVRTLDQLLGRLSEVLAQRPAGEWVQGYFWNVDPPSRAYLDPISPDNPVWLIQRGGHFGSCNTAALEIAGITAQTPNPVGGVIERDAAGVPTGRFYNHRAMDLVRRFAPQPTQEMIQANIHMAERRFAEVGVTTFQDCNARFSALQAYLEAGRQHAMTLRGDVYYTVEWKADLDRALNQIDPYADEFLRFSGYKFLIDGQFPTWYTHEPHAGISWDMPTWDPRTFKEAIKALHDTGFQIAVHCGGDAAVDLTLDAYEEAMNANPRPDPRHRIEHAVLCTEDAVRRMADLGVVVSSQPQFIRFGRDLVGVLGQERASRIIVTRDWLDAGIIVALGSDTPSAPWYEPQVTLVGAVLRPDADGQRYHPEQAMTIREALWAHTMGSAVAGHEEQVKGSLEPGKFADLAVWNEDLTRIRPAEILRSTAALTMIGGRIVYQA